VICGVSIPAGTSCGRSLKNDDYGDGSDSGNSGDGKPPKEISLTDPQAASRDIDEDVREHVRALANTETFQLSCRERKKVEVRFAHMKRILKLDRLRLRGLSGAKDEVLLTATAQNLRRLAKLI
jgi:Transposase DDE domain